MLSKRVSCTQYSRTRFGSTRRTAPQPSPPSCGFASTPRLDMKVCVLGGGNSAHVSAGLIASLPDCESRIFAPFADEAQRLNAGIAKGGIQVAYPHDKNIPLKTGAPSAVSNKAEDVVPGCDILLVCLPAMAYESTIQLAAPHADVGAAIGTICASNGFDWVVDEAMSKVGRSPDSYGVFALQNLPWACRIAEYGYKVDVLGEKPFMELVSRPTEKGLELGQLMTKFIGVNCAPVRSGFVGVGLSNVCQVIHPTIMHDNFKDWDGKTPYTEKPLFYQGLSEEAAQRMHVLADEIQGIRKNLEARYPGIDLSIVHHMFDWNLWAYGKYIVDASTMRTRLATNRAYEGLTCPMKPVDGGFVPHYQARYLSEGVAELCGVETPTIDMILDWSQKVLGKEYIVNGKLTGKDVAQSFAPQRFGFTKLEDIPEFQKLGGDRSGGSSS